MKHLLVAAILTAVGLSFVLGFIVSDHSRGFDSVETQVNNKRRSDSLKVIIEFNNKMLKIYDK